MRAGTFTIIRFTAAAATVALVAAQPYLPAKTLQLLPAKTTQVAINGYVDPVTGAHSATWIDPAQNHWRCDFDPKHSIHNPCGIAFGWGLPDTDRAPDLSNSARPPCRLANADPDGDGWGWENGQSCTASSEAKAAQRDDPAATGHGATVINGRLCERPDADSDGNGWGWDGVGICRAPLALRAERLRTNGGASPVCPAGAVDLDGDGKSYFSGVECAVAVEATAPPPRTEVQPPPAGRTDTPARARQAERKGAQGIDFSRYRGINLTLAYEGSSPFLRLYLQNYNPAYATADNIYSNKFMSKVVLTENTKAGSTYVSLDSFSVAEWWIHEYEIPREWAQPELDQIVGMGIDLVQFGVHKLKVERVELVGDWISFNTLLLSLAVFWSIYLAGEGLLQYAMMRRRAQRGEAELDLLSHAAQMLEDEKRALARLATTDTLTGLPNRAGLAQQIRHLSERGRLDPRAGVILLDIDHFKHLNVSHGHEVGDRILTELAEVLAREVRQGDLLARWGGEEFVLVCPACPGQQLLKLAEHQRAVIAAHRFGKEAGLHLTISLGATHYRAEESFESVFRRADLALLEAKTNRNDVIYHAPVPPEASR